MNPETKKSLDKVYAVEAELENYAHAFHIINFDMETIAPSKAIAAQGDLLAFIGNKAFLVEKAPEFVEAFEYLHSHEEELDEFDRVLIESLHRNHEKTKNITPEKDLEFSKIRNAGFAAWMEAKANADYSIFEKPLTDIRSVELEMIKLDDHRLPNAYDNLLDRYERGMRSADLDQTFGAFKERMIPLLKKIQASKKKIRRDFLSRRVTDAQQKEFAEYLLRTIGFDFDRGSFTTTEHPFTDGLALDDVRVTTHYYPEAFASSMYSIIHEGGHALFEMFQPRENYAHYINNQKTMGMHESVSRFYENRIGRSKGFIHLIYPKAKEIFAPILDDVSENELYEALNIVEPSLIRTEADEFTYVFHIIIRYEIEKEIIAGTVSMHDLPALWNKKYQEYLGIVPGNDREGLLQDVHWASGFGYFPTYALGNMYNAMYYNAMAKDFDIEAALSSGDTKKILDWMAERVFQKADRLTAKEWIKGITGREFTPNDFLDYLEEKYTKLYEI